MKSPFLFLFILLGSIGHHVYGLGVHEIDKKTEQTHRVATPVVSVMEAGRFHERTRGLISLQAPILTTRDGATVESETAIVIREAHRTVTDETKTTERGGPLQKDYRFLESTTVGTSVGGVAEGTARFLAPRIDLTNMGGPLELEAEDIVFRPGTTYRHHTEQEHNSDLLWVDGYRMESEFLTYDPLDLSNVLMNRGNVVVEYGARQNLDLLRQQIGRDATFMRVYDHHTSYYDDYSAPGALTSTLAAIAINYVLPGFGNGLGATMAHAAASSAISQGILTGRIDPVDLLVSAATAGVFHGATSYFDSLKTAATASTKTFAQHLALNMTRSAINGTVNAAFGRDVKVFDVAVNGLASAVGAWGASEIGNLYFDQDVGYLGHKGLHFGLGFGMGAALNPDHWATAGISGGIAGAVAEMAAEGMIGNPGYLKQNHIDPNAVQGRLFLSKAIGTMAGSLIIEGADPMAAMLIARSAVENNSLRAIMRAFEDQTSPVETWEDRVEQERLVLEAYTNFKNQLVTKAEVVGGTGGKLAAEILIPSHPSLIIPELMINLSAVGSGIKFAVKAPKYGAALARSIPKALDTTRSFFSSLVNPRQTLKAFTEPLNVGKKLGSVTREKRWKELAAEGKQSRLPKELREHIRRHKGKGVSDKFGLELAHRPKMAKAQGYDYSNAVPKTIADHRGVQHRFLQESKEGTRIIKGGYKPNKLTLPKRGKLP